MRLASDFQQHQTSDDWQNGVRWENRFKKMEEKNKELENRIWWFYVLVGAIGLLTAASFFHH